MKDLITQVISELNVENQSGAAGEAWLRDAVRRSIAIVLRHTAGVYMAEAGVPMEEISQYLGHTSTKVTERVYARYSPEYLRNASNAIERRMKNG